MRGSCLRKEIAPQTLQAARDAHRRFQQGAAHARSGLQRSEPDPALIPTLQRPLVVRAGGTASITEAIFRNHGAALSTRRALASTSMPTEGPPRVTSIWG